MTNSRIHANPLSPVLNSPMLTPFPLPRAICTSVVSHLDRSDSNRRARAIKNVPGLSVIRDNLRVVQRRVATP